MSGTSCLKYQDQIASLALGFTEPEQTSGLRDHLDSGCPFCREELSGMEESLSLLPLQLGDVPMPSGLKQKLAARVQSVIRPEIVGMLDFANIGWEDIDMPGVRVHWLRRDESTGTTAALLHIRPGHTFLNHRHIGSEDCLVLRGTLRDSRGVYRAGEYVHYEPGSIQQDIRALEGEDCILFIVNQQGIELI